MEWNKEYSSVCMEWYNKLFNGGEECNFIRSNVCFYRYGKYHKKCMIRTAGSVIVGERGAELLTLPRGAQVTPLARTSATKNTNHFDIRIYADGKSVDEIIDEFIPKLKLALANL